MTALGSVTLVVLFSAFTLLVLLVLRDRMGALQLLAASREDLTLAPLQQFLEQRARAGLSFRPSNRQAGTDLGQAATLLYQSDAPKKKQRPFESICWKF